MIVKIVPSKGTGSFGGLSDYLQDKKNLHKDKVELVYFENCEFQTEEDNLKLIDATQKNTTSKADPTLHLVVSFQEDEKPSSQQLKDITHELLKSINIEHHQRLCVTHDNTNNYHLHLAINRIDPDTQKRARLPFSKMKLQKKAAEIEEKYFLKRDNHIPNWILAEQDRKTNVGGSRSTVAKDIQAHTGITNLTEWIQENALDEIKSVLGEKSSTLKELHEVLAKYNLEIKERGNGLIVKDKTRNLFCKASDIDRNLSKSKLENLYGSFMAMNIDIKSTTQFGTQKTKLWEEYQKETKNRKNIKRDKLEPLKAQYFKSQAEIKSKSKNGIEQLKKHKFTNKKIKMEAYKTIFAKQRTELQDLRDEYTKEKNNIFKDNKFQTYNEYLISKALSGDTQALEKLRKSTPKARSEDNAIIGKKDNRLFISYKLLITKLGYVIYKLDSKNDNSKIIDKGNHLKLVNASDETLLRALEMAKLKYGKELDITGDDAFKTKVISLVQKHTLDINFKDPKMQEILRPAVHKKPKDKSINL